MEKQFIASQNAEHENAVNAVDAETPETDTSNTGFDSGASAQTISDLKAKKKKITQLTTEQGIDGLIENINQTYGTTIDSEEHLLEVIQSLRESGQNFLGDNISSKLIKIRVDAEKQSKLKPEVIVEVTPINEEEGGDLADNIGQLQDSNTTSNTIESVSATEKEISDKEVSQNQEHYIGDKLKDAYRHIAYLARKFTNITTVSGFIKQDLELNEKASKLILDYTKINVGTAISLEVMHDYDGDIYTGEFGTKP